MKDMIRKIGRLLFFPPVFFSLLLAWFFFSSPWYPAAVLSVSGTATSLKTNLDIHFDSGKGFNRYEREKFPLEPLSAEELADGIEVSISRTGLRNSASSGAKVVLRQIWVDGEKFFPSDITLPQGVAAKNGALVFFQDGAALQLRVKPKRSLQLEFPAANTMGKVEVRIAGKTANIDLFSTNDESQWANNARYIQSWFVSPEGKFTVSMPMPRYAMRTLQVSADKDISLSSARIDSADGRTLWLKGSEGISKTFDFPMAVAGKQLKRFFHPHRLFFQVFFALLCTWIASRMAGFAGRFHGLKEIFVQEQRYLFWSMLLLCCLLFSFWHISFWPAVTSTDSLEIWRAAHIPGTYLGDHPPLNVIFYLFLSQFWDNVAFVPLVQNFLTSLLTAYIFFSLFRMGLPLRWLIPFYAVVALSLPVGLYTIVLWKDVPFSLIVVLIGFKLAAFALARSKGSLRVSKLEWFDLFLLTLAAVGFRHNGVLYLAIIPLLLLLFGIVRIRPLVLASIFTASLLVGCFFFFFSGCSKTTDYLASQSKAYLGQAMQSLSIPYLEKCAKDYVSIFDVNQRNVQWDLIHLCVYGRYQIDFIKNIRWNDVYPYLPLPSGKVKKSFAKRAWQLYWKSYQQPWVYLSWNPFYMLPFLPLLPLMFRKLPMTSIFSLYIFLPVAVLVFLNISNWRYYYFAHLACYFLLPFVVTDCVAARKRKSAGMIDAIRAEDMKVA